MSVCLSYSIQQNSDFLFHKAWKPTKKHNTASLNGKIQFLINSGDPLCRVVIGQFTLSKTEQTTVENYIWTQSTWQQQNMTSRSFLSLKILHQMTIMNPISKNWNLLWTAKHMVRDLEEHSGKVRRCSNNSKTARQNTSRTINTFQGRPALKFFKICWIDMI